MKRYLSVVAIILMLTAPSFAAQGWEKVDNSFKVTAGMALTIGNTVYIASDGKGYLADTDDATKLPVAGLVYRTVASGASVSLIEKGITGGLTSLTPGSKAYLSATAGAVTQTKPKVNPLPIGLALSATRYSIDTSQPSELRGYTISFADDNLVTAQTDAAMTTGGSATVSESEFPCAGSIISVTVTANEARTAGTVIVEPTVNGTGTGLQATLDNTDTTHASTTQGILLDTLAAGDRIGIDYTTTIDWAPVSADFFATVGVSSGCE